jgi:hypothetical protein
MAEEENALAIDALHDAFALWDRLRAFVAVIPVTGFNDFNVSHN